MGRKKSNSRKPKFSIAILGEGITEWHYFDGLKKHKRYSFKISPELPKHSSYNYIFKDAQKLINQGYDKVYCVIDVDTINCDKKEIEKYVKEKSKLIKNKAIKVIESMPCIEYWFLLHYIDFSTKIYPTYKSLKPSLQKYLPKYEKTEHYYKKIKLYSTLNKIGDEEKATITAGRLDDVRLESDNPLFPYSEIYLLLSDLSNKK